MANNGKKSNKSDPVHVIGGGLAGSEAAWQLAQKDVPVVLHEMRPTRGTDAHLTDGFAELVCSNSFRSDDAQQNAVGVIHAEMRRANSLIMQAGDATKVPAGSALAVDREQFSAYVSAKLEGEALIEIKREEVSGMPPPDWAHTIIATGPLTAPSLAKAIADETGEDSLAFFDAIAPILHFDSVDLDTAWFQSRYDKVGPGGNGKDYINCPLDRDQYEAFIDALIAGDKTEFKQWEGTPYFDGCLPIEVMAERGRETPRHGPMKPMGLTNAHKPDEKAYAVVQLRQDNAFGTLYNMVGFQTKLKYGAQAEIFRMIPGLENAEFARLGGIHRNTYINSPQVLNPHLALNHRPNVRFAGQITGCEGYVESAAIGILAAHFAASDMLGEPITVPPVTTAMGALLHHITSGHMNYDADGQSNAGRSFQPMNVNFGLFPPLPAGATAKPEGHEGRWRGKDKAIAKKRAYSARALKEFDHWISQSGKTSKHGSPESIEAAE